MELTWEQFFLEFGPHYGTVIMLVYLVVVCWFGERLVKFCQTVINERR